MSYLTNYLVESLNGGKVINGMVEASKLDNPIEMGIWLARFSVLQNDWKGVFNSLSTIDFQDLGNNSKASVETHLLKVLAYATQSELEMAKSTLNSIVEIKLRDDWFYLRGLKEYTEGVLGILEGKLEEASRHLETAVELFSETNFVVFTVKAFLNLGTAHVYSDDFDNAERCYYQALFLSSQAGNDDLQFKSHFYLLTVLFEKGEIDSCIQYDEVLAPRENLPNPNLRNVIDYSSLIGLCYKLEGKYNDALQLMEETLIIAKRYRIHSAFSFLLSEISIVHFELGNLDTSKLMISEAILFCDYENNTEDLFLLETRKRMIEIELGETSGFDEFWNRKILTISGQISFRFLLPEKMFQILYTMLNLEFDLLEEKIAEGIQIFENRFKTSSIETIRIKINILKTKEYLNRISRQRVIDFQFLNNQISALEIEDKRLSKLAVLLEIQIRLMEFRLDARDDTEKKLKLLIEDLLTQIEDDSSVHFKVISKVLSSKVFWLFKEINESIRLFDDALTIAKAKGLNQQFSALQQEKSKMIKEIKEWREISLSLEQQLKVYEKADLMEYAKKVSRILSHLMG